MTSRAALARRFSAPPAVTSLLLALMAAACSSPTNGDSGECTVTAPTACPSPEPTYSDDIAPILERRCVTCHSGKTEQWPLTSYEHTVEWEDLIRAALLQCAMPPADSGMHIPAEESQVILNWLRCGMPE